MQEEIRKDFEKTFETFDGMRNKINKNREIPRLSNR
jgi:hypothetical protein